MIYSTVFFLDRPAAVDLLDFAAAGRVGHAVGHLAPKSHANLATHARSSLANFCALDYGSLESTRLDSWLERNPVAKWHENREYVFPWTGDGSGSLVCEYGVQVLLVCDD